MLLMIRFKFYSFLRIPLYFIFLAFASNCSIISILFIFFSVCFQSFLMHYVLAKEHKYISLFICIPVCLIGEPFKSSISSITAIWSIFYKFAFFLGYLHLLIVHNFLMFDSFSYKTGTLISFILFVLSFRFLLAFG